MKSQPTVAYWKATAMANEEAANVARRSAADWQRRYEAEECRTHDICRILGIDRGQQLMEAVVAIRDQLRDYAATVRELNSRLAKLAPRKRRKTAEGRRGRRR